MRQKILIVKLGYTETIDHRCRSNSISLGDIFRTTAILHIFKNDNVTWLTTKEGGRLLEGNPYIDRILIYDAADKYHLQGERFDVLVNLEKTSGICALVESVRARKRYGFKLNKKRGIVEACEYSYEVLANSDDPELRKKMKKNWIEMLYEMVGEKWNGEGYVLGYKPKQKEEFDIGFNINVSRRWPGKAWPRKYWNELEKLIGNRYSISYQRSLSDVRGYIDWINGCRLIITNDSLGLHLAIALRKKIIALFGPTSEKEVHLFDSGKVVRPLKKLVCMPCFSSDCKYGKSCMHMIKPDMIYDKIRRYLKNRTGNDKKV